MDVATVAASPGPKVLGPDEYDWPESEGGFRNRLVDCYMISAVQVVGAVRAARLAVGGLQMSPLHPRVRFFGGLQADFARAGGGPAPESQAAVMCEHAGAGFQANQQEDAEAAISTCLDAWGEAERPVAGQSLHKTTFCLACWRKRLWVARSAAGSINPGNSF